MRSHRKRLLDTEPTPRAILRGEARRNRDDGNAMHLPIGAHPGEEEPPTGIADALGQMVILDQGGNLEVFVGDQIVRLDQRPRRLDGEVFPLPTDFQIPSGKFLDGFLTILRTLDLAGDTPMQALQSLFSAPEIARIGNGRPVAVGREGFQAHINPHLLAGRFVSDPALCLHGKLAIVAIGALDEPDPLDLLKRKRLNTALLPDQSAPSDAHAIGEGEMLAIRLQHPPAGLILNRSVVFLETWVALLSWLLFSAVCVEASNSLPRPVSTGLARHRIEPGCKGILFRQLSAEGLHVILAYAARIHPEPQRFVPDELRGANGFLYRGLLALVDSQLVVEY